MVRIIIEYLTANWREQPSLEHRRHRRHGADQAAEGVHPLGRHLAKGFLQAVTLDHAKTLLAQSATVLDTTYEVGLSGPGRLHDLFVTHEAVTPGTYRARGEGLLFRYGFHASPFGTALVMATERGLAGVAFAEAGEEGGARRHDAALAQGRSIWRMRLRPLPSPRGSSTAGNGGRTRRSASSSSAAISRSASGKRSSRCRSGAPRPIPTSRAASSARKPAARSARRSDATRSPSWCLATGSSAAPAALPAITGA